MFKPDVLIVIEYHLKDEEKTHIRTNAKKEALGELLANWILDRMFLSTEEGRKSGEEAGDPVDRDFYTVRIGYRVEPEAFGHESDTGDRRTTIGIVSVVLGLLPDVDIRPLP